LPAVAASRQRLQIGLQAGRTMARSTSGWGKVLVVAQVALSLTLLVGAGLFAGSLAKLRSIDTGFRASGIVWGRAYEIPGGYNNNLDPSSYYPELVLPLGELPGVQSVVLSHIFPAYFGFPLTFDPVARTDPQDASNDVPGLRDALSPHFL